MSRFPKISWTEITPESVYLNRRQLMAAAGAVLGAVSLAACGVQPPPAPAAQTAPAPELPPTATPDSRDPVAGGASDELGDPLNTYEQITNYNNFYEFSTDKEAVARLARDFPLTPWTVTVGGLVDSPTTYDMDDIRKLFDIEERIYRLRCVEAWSMVIPWLGFPLGKLLAAAGPKSDAKYVRFQTLHNPELMPGQRSAWYSWPYTEGLRLDEAMNDLAILSTGLYGKDLLPQSGAPLRLVVPWKYGFKSIKSIVSIELVAEEPNSLWMDAAPNEYGFYANVNPDVNHPRWSQASERRIGELGRRTTLPFNGYAEQVAHLYDGMDLRKNF
ncbi:MAG: protein-methionine-sulfoxide reductase catalytic subunit MsrP [Caldilineaceae bacterium]|nr:protein-methionine-sulfoxide reductase catalytic subunit MsrP [Caldilineaceae bacterium]HRJ45019.1 protein-methionine-sulfoxide reductase catalytic subunit MsrP [Caldilineaceae bacterium]